MADCERSEVEDDVNNLETQLDALNTGEPKPPVPIESTHIIKGQCSRCYGQLQAEITTTPDGTVTGHIQTKREYSDFLKVLKIFGEKIGTGECGIFDALHINDDLKNVMKKLEDGESGDEKHYLFFLILRPCSGNKLEDFLDSICGVSANPPMKLVTDGNYSSFVDKFFNESTIKKEEAELVRIPHDGFTFQPDAQLRKACIISAIKLENLMLNKIKGQLPKTLHFLTNEQQEKIGAFELYKAYEHWAAGRPEQEANAEPLEAEAEDSEGDADQSEADAENAD